MPSQLARTLTLPAALSIVILFGCQTPDPAGPGPGPGPGPKGNASIVVDTVPAKFDIAWQHPLPQGNALLSVHFPTPTVGYSVGLQGVILKTTDAGKTFIRQDGGAGNLHGVRFFDAERGIAIGAKGLILRTADGGANWSHSIVGGSDLQGLCLDGDRTAFAVGDFGLALKTEDSGFRWTLENTGTTANLLECDFLAGDTVRIAAKNALHFSPDGGETWAERNPETFIGWWQDWALLDIHHFSASIGYGLFWDIPYQTKDGGKTWSAWHRVWPQEQDAPLPASEMVFTQGRAVLVGHDGKVFTKSLDGDDTPWVPYQTSTHALLLAVHFPTPDTGFATSMDGEILRSIDGGLTWADCGNVVTKEDLKAVHFVSNRLGYAAGKQGTLLKTRDGGTTWEALRKPTVRDFHGIHFYNEAVGCVVGAGGTALWTADGGESWTLTGTGIDKEILDVRLIDFKTAYAGTQHAVYRTEDAGRTWKPLEFPSMPYGGVDLPGGVRYDGLAFYAADDRFNLNRGQCICMGVRAGPGAEWLDYFFTGGGFPSLPVAITRAGTEESAYVAVGANSLFLMDPSQMTLAHKATDVHHALADISCPDARNCFAVGDHGTILKATRP